MDKITVDPSLIKQAQGWLDQLDKDLSQELKFEKSGEVFVRRMESEIRRYQGEMFKAIRAALGIWLRGYDEGKFLLALDLIDRLEASEYVGELEQLYNQLRTGTSRWPPSWLSLVKVILKHLREVEEREKGTEK